MAEMKGLFTSLGEASVRVRLHVTYQLDDDATDGCLTTTNKQEVNKDDAIMAQVFVRIHNMSKEQMRIER